MYKTKEEIEKEFDFNFCDELGFCNDTKQRDLLDYIHKIRQDDFKNFIDIYIDVSNEVGTSKKTSYILGRLTGELQEFINLNQ